MDINAVPSTVEEVEAKLRECVGGDNVGSRAMIGIFQVRMEMGDDLLKAYEAALKAYIGAADKRTEGRNDRY